MKTILFIFLFFYGIFFPPIHSELNYKQATSDTYKNKYGRIKTYIPTDNSPQIIIKIAFHFFQDEDSLNNWNFEKNPDQQKRFQQIMDWVNAPYVSSATPSDSVIGASYLQKNSKIKFEVTGYYFYQNDELNKTTYRNLCEKHVKKIDPSRLESFPIYYTAGVGAYGNTTMPSETDMSANQSIITFNYKANPIGDYAMSQHLAHELGHALDLYHTYDGNQNGIYSDFANGVGDACCAEDINPNLPDYLSDVFDVPWKNWCNNTKGMPCYHQNGFSCDPAKADNYCTNNLMGGSSWNTFISPMQMGKMRRALAIKSIRKYAKAIESSLINWVVSENETWDFDIQMCQNILVTNKATLTITKKLLMALNGKIIVDKGASLIVSDAVIDSWGSKWGGIELRKKSRLIVNKSVINNWEFGVKANKKAKYQLLNDVKIIKN